MDDKLQLNIMASASIGPNDDGKNDKFHVIDVKVKPFRKHENGELREDPEDEAVCRRIMKRIYADINNVFEKKWEIQVQSIKDLTITCRVFSAEQLKRLWNQCCDGVYHPSLGHIIFDDDNHTVSLSALHEEYTGVLKMMEANQCHSHQQVSISNTQSQCTSGNDSVPEKNTLSIPQSTRLSSAQKGVKSVFMVYVPCPVKKTWLKVSDGHNSLHHEMFQDRNDIHVWLSREVLIGKDCEYHYGAKFQDSSFFFLKFKKGEKFEEPTFRRTRQRPVHLDLFELPSEFTGEPTSEPYKYLLKSLFVSIETHSDVVNAVEEYKLLQVNNAAKKIRLELVRYATECVGTNTNECAAAFIIYFISQTLPDDSPDLQRKGILKNNVESLFHVLHNTSLEAVLGIHMHTRIEKILLWLLEIFCSYPTWVTFAYWCYPLLNAKLIIDQERTMRWSYAEDILDRLCQFASVDPNSCDLILVAMNHTQLMRTRLRAFKKLKQTVDGNSFDHMFGKYDWVTDVKNQLPSIYHKTSHLPDLNELVGCLDELDMELVVKLAPSLENHIVNILDKREEISPNELSLCRLVEHPKLFSQPKSVQSLLYMASNSHLSSVQNLFLVWLENEKLTNVLDCEEIVHLVDSWLKAARRRGPIANQNVSQWYQYGSRLLKLPFLSKSEVKDKIIDIVTGFLRQVSSDIVTNLNQTKDFETVSQLWQRMTNLDENLVVIVRVDVELSVITILLRARVCKPDHLDVLHSLLLHERLFVKVDCVIKALEVIVESPMYEVHAAYLRIMRAAKFWDVIPSSEMERLFGRWIEVAFAKHCLERARKVKMNEHRLPSLYEYLVEVFGLSILEKRCPEIKCQLEQLVKEKCADVDATLRLDLLEKMNKSDKITKDARDLMEKHVDEIQCGSLIPEQELLKRLDAIGQDGKSDLDFTNRSILKVLLQYAYSQLKKFDDNLSKELFIMQSAAFWKKVVKCSSSRKRELKMMDCLSLVEQIVTEFIQKTEKCRLSVCEFHQFKVIFSKRHELILSFMKTFPRGDRFEFSLNCLEEKLTGALHKLNLVETVYNVFVVKLQDRVSVCDADSTKEHMTKLKKKISKESEASFAEICSTGFFGPLEDIVEPCSKLIKMKQLKTFLVLSARAASNLHEHLRKSSSTPSLADDSLSVSGINLYDDEDDSGGESEELRHVKVQDLITFLSGACTDDYKNWLKKIIEDGTLEEVTRYSSDYKVVSQDLREADKLFDLHVTNELLSSLEWLEQLDDNCKRVKHIQKLLNIFNVDARDSPLEKAMKMFLKCVSEKKTVTVTELAFSMTELKELLSDTTDDWWNTVGQLSMATELIKFLQETIEDDFRNLIDAVEERSEQTIDESTVSDLIKVKQLLQPVIRKKTFPVQQELLETLKKSLQKENLMSIRINNCAHHVHGLKALYQHVANRGELTKEIIHNAMTIGRYRWLLNTGMSKCVCTLSYKISKRGKGKQGKFEFDAEAMNDLKSRALLISTSDKDTSTSAPQKALVALQDFKSIVDKVQDIGQVVTELHALGHFEFTTFHKKVDCVSALESQLLSLHQDLTGKLYQWKLNLKDCRMTYGSLNFLFADQLSEMCSYLLMQSDTAIDNNVDHIMHFIHPGATINDVEGFRRASDTGPEMSNTEKLALVGKVLDQVKIKKTCARRQFPQTKLFALSNNVNAIVQPGQLFIVQLETGSTQTIPVLLSLYANTMNDFPVPSEILFCHNGTSWEEVYLLIQRCLQVTELHCIANVERLSNAVQYQLVDELGHLVNRQDDPQYKLAIICRGGSHYPIVDYFSSFVHHVQGFDTATLTACLQATWTEVVMVTSNVPGLGKTEKIMSVAAEKGCYLKSVHVSGPISRGALVSRLKSQALKSTDILHLDIGEVDDPDLLDAALFEYIVLGCLSAGTNIAYLPSSQVFIEVANTLQDRLRNSLVVLSCFGRRNIRWDDYTDYIVSKQLESPVQVVCHYLLALDGGVLDSKDIKLSGKECVSPLSADTCRNLLKKHLSIAGDKDISFSVIEIFLNVFAGQLRKLSSSLFFTVRGLKDMLGADKGNDVRSKLVMALMDVAKEFASRSVQSCKASQSLAEATVRSSSEVAGITAADLMAQRVEGMLQWADSNHLLIVFHTRDSHSVSPLYRDKSKVPVHIKELFKTQSGKELPDFSEFTQRDLTEMLGRIARVSPQAEYLDEADRAYAVTPDNVLKMVLILLRIRANIPVIIMGETGCGKTSLIRYLAHTCDIEFKHMNIHAGITAEKIVEEVIECHKVCVSDRKKQMWLFLDEINTCEHMGLLTEIICHHSCHGETLARNLVLLAACNPYRLRDESQISTAGLDGKIKTDEFSKLVYRVHPLPETMIDYVWDYGTLSGEDEKSYIRNMVEGVFGGTEWPDKLTDLLVVSQNFMKTAASNSSCVSLRDVHRCRLLVNFFHEMQLKKMSAGSKHSSEDTVRRNAVVLALAHCYQSRLATSSLRKDYWKECSTVLNASRDKYRSLIHIIDEEQEDLLNRMELPQGIAKNTALCENVFIILVCILNRIPVFLVGKPGCSKSLSMQLIKSNLRGKDSKDEYFQTLPNLYVVSYQGSESSTSDGIIKVFKKAEKYLEANRHENVLPVVLLDEVGLAEVSKFNPLKVLHSLLEPQTGRLPSVAVVGISNWSLDAAKMNRAIHLSRPDMNKSELFKTGESISTVRSSLGDTDCLILKDTLRALAKVYFEYQRSQHIKNFHGLRDYYSLIKYISRLVQDGTDDPYDTVIQKGLLRNFGGLSVESNEVVRRFLNDVKEATSYSWKTEAVISDNLGDKTARHLMIITSGDSGLGILLRSMSSSEQKAVVIFGSKFEEDQTEEYSYKVLNRIILCMEEGRILLLKDLDNIYGSLYDMLNQNYTVVGCKKNCRIALGAHSNPMCQVHDCFRCIVLVDESKVNYSDPPFLNRFEKQLLRFEDIISEKQKKFIDILEDWVEDFSSIKNLPFGKQHAFLGLNSDTIPSLVYQVTESDDSLEPNEILDVCKKALLWLASPDAIMRLSQSELHSKDIIEVRSVQNLFFARPVHMGLSIILEKLVDSVHCEDLPPKFVKSFGLRLVVFTHSNIHIDLQKTLSHFHPVLIQKLGAFKSERELTKHLKQFFESSAGLYVLQCKPSDDGNHIPLAKFLLEELQQEYAKSRSIGDPKKHVCIVLHMDRASSPLSSGWQFNYLSGWQLVTLDSVEDPGLYPLVDTSDVGPASSAMQTVMPILQHDISELLDSEFKHVVHCVQENLIWAFTCTASCKDERSIGEFSFLVQNINSSRGMMKCLADAVLKSVKESYEECNRSDLCDPQNWQVKVAFDLQLLHSSSSFIDAIKNYLTKCVTIPLANVIHKLEMLSAWHSYFTDDERTTTLWESLFRDSCIVSLTDMKIPRGVGCFQIDRKPLSFQCPFSQCYIDKFHQFEELFKTDFRNSKTYEGVGLADELSTKSYLELFNQYKNLFIEKILIEMPDILSTHWQELIQDICNHYSFGFPLQDHERIDIMMWFCDLKRHQHEASDAETYVTETLLCIWRYDELRQALLQLITQCRAMLPGDINDVLCRSETRVEHIAYDVEPHVTDIVNSFGEMVLVERDDVTRVDDDETIESMKDAGSSTALLEIVRSDSETEPVILDASEHVPIKLTELGGEDEMSCLDSAGESRPHDLNDGVNSADVNTSELTEEEDERVARDSSHLLSIAAFDITTVSTDVNENSVIDTADVRLADETDSDVSDELRPEERLVDSLCRGLIPTHVVMDKCGGVHKWHTKVCSVLSFSSSVSSYPTALHELRMFNDFATVFNKECKTAKLESYLVELANEISSLECKTSFLLSEEALSLVYEFSDRLKNDKVPNKLIQAFVCMYIGRCIDSNPEANIMEQFLLRQVSCSLPDGEIFLHLGPIVHRCLLETEHLFRGFIEMIDTGSMDHFSSNTYILTLNDVLQKETSHRLPLLVLCVDVIKYVVFEPHNWGDLEFIESADDILLTTYKAAVDFLDSETEVLSLQTAACAAYVLVFSRHMFEILAYDSTRGHLANHAMLFQVVHSVLDNCDIRFSYLLLKEAIQDKSLSFIKRFVEIIKEALPCLVKCKLPDDDLSLSLGHRVLTTSAHCDEQLKQALLLVEKDSAYVREFLTKSSSPVTVLQLVETLCETHYLPSYVRPLKDVEKQTSKWLMDNSDLGVLGLPLLCLLLQRLSGQTTFGVELLQLTPGSNYNQLLQASVVLHLVSVVIAKKSESGYGFFWSCLEKPADKKVCEVREILLSQKNWELAWNRACEFTVCRKCWTKMCTKKCCECCSVCGKECSKQLSGDGTVPTQTESEFVCQSMGQQMARDVLMLLIDACLVGSVGVGIVESSAMSSIFDTSEHAGDVLTSSQIATKFQEVWVKLSSVLQLKDRELSVLLHYLIDKWNILHNEIDVACDNLTLKGLEAVEKSIMEELLKPMLHERLRLYQDRIVPEESKLLRYLLELPVEAEEDHDNIICALRWTTDRSLTDMKAQLYFTGKQVDHRVLCLFFEMADVLSLLKHLTPILKWSLLCLQMVSHKHSRNECREMFVEKLLVGKTEKEKKCYEDFEVSWNELRSAENMALLSINVTLSPLPSLHKRLPVQTVLIENEDSLLYKVLKLLVAIQNSFLDKLLSLSYSGNCPVIGFLRRPKLEDVTTSVPSVGCVLLQNVADSQLVHFDKDDLTNTLLSFAQNNLCYGLGRQISYNFTKIEMELANELVLGKSYLLLDDTFPRVVYASELFVSCTSVLREFKAQIMQYPLGPSVVSGIKEKQLNNSNYVQKMMRQTEVLLSLVKKTGGSCDQTIDSYIQTWQKTLPGGFSAQLLPSGGEPLRLSHLVALYECLESMQADIVVDILDDHLKEPLSDTMKNDISDFLESSGIHVSVVEIALKRFIVRSLINFDLENIDLDQSLAYWIVEPSLWPDTPLEMRGMSLDAMLKAVNNDFPRMLNLSHAQSMLIYIKQRVSETQRQVKWMPQHQRVTSGESSPVAKAAHGTRTRTRGRLGKT